MLLALLVLVVGASTLLIAMLDKNSIPAQQNIGLPQATPSATLTSPPRPTYTNVVIEPTSTALPALLGNVTPTPLIFLPKATTTARATDAANRYKRVRCDNAAYWSLPIADSQYRFSAGFGIQPVGSLY